LDEPERSAPPNLGLCGDEKAAIRTIPSRTRSERQPPSLAAHLLPHHQPAGNVLSRRYDVPAPAPSGEPLEVAIPLQCAWRLTTVAGDFGPADEERAGWERRQGDPLKGTEPRPFKMGRLVIPGR